MNRIGKYLSFAALATLPMITSCVEETYELESAKLMYSIEIDMATEQKAKLYVDQTESLTLPMLVGEKIQLNFVSDPADASELTYPEVAWSSSDEDVITVSEDGVVTAKKAGIAVVTVAPSTVNLVANASIKVNVVSEVVEVTSIEISDDTVNKSEISEYPSCFEGETMGLTAKVTPEDATYKTVLWSSADEEIATVDPLTGIVTGVKSGEVDIIATALDAGKVSEKYRIFIDKVVMPEGFRILNAPQKDEIFSLGQIDYQLQMETYPAVSTRSKIQWTSSDPSVASVDKNGLVTFKGFGSAVISAVCPESEATLADGFVKQMEMVFTVPAGYYRESFADPRVADKWIATSGGTKTYHPATETSEAYNLYLPGVQNASEHKYRVDAKRSESTYLTREFPFMCFRIDDVADRGFTARALKLDTNGNTEDGTRYYGDFGGGSGTWFKKYACSDGSAILVYDLSTQKFKEDLILPEGQVLNLATLCFKYADIVNANDNPDEITYRLFWFNTFRTEDEMNQYLREWSDKTMISWGDYVPGLDPSAETVGFKLNNAPEAGKVFSISEGSFTAEYEKTMYTGALTWTSSAPEVATVDETGKVTFVSFGTTEITVSCAADKTVEEGYVTEAKFTVEIPAGYYREELANKLFADLWVVGSGQGAVTYNAEGGYNLFEPGVQNADQKKYRVDAKRNGSTFLTRDWPVLCFRIDDVNDKGFSRALKVDTYCKVSDEVEYKGDLGGGNATWTKKYKCSDGSAILVYNLNDRNFKNKAGEWGLLPENEVFEFTTFSFKYADIVKPDENTIADISYRLFWFNTFKTTEDMLSYLDAWAESSKITYTE